MFHTNRTFDVLYTGYENDGSTVIDADLPVGACVCTVEGASSIDSETGLQKVTRPATANLVRARKLIVAASDNLINVNSIPNASAPTKRKGGVVTVYDPCHPANQDHERSLANVSTASRYATLSCDSVGSLGSSGPSEVCAAKPTRTASVVSSAPKVLDGY